MFEWQDVKNAKLGEPFETNVLKNCCKAVYGGVSWPGKRPGFAVVITMDRTRHIDNYDVCLLEEYESFDIRELVRLCGVLNFKYSPCQWIGDWKNDAANRFISEMNDELRDRNGPQLNLSWTLLFEMEPLYPYILAEIRRLLVSEHRQLYLKDSKIRGYLSEIEGSEIADLERSDYPAIEALAYAVIEIRRWAEGNDDKPCPMLPDRWWLGIG